MSAAASSLVTDGNKAHSLLLQKASIDGNERDCWSRAQGRSFRIEVALHQLRGLLKHKAFGPSQSYGIMTEQKLRSSLFSLFPTLLQKN
jgi:hypothetical protein